MSELIRKEHNANVLMYHIVRPAKYRRAVITEEIDKKLKEICLGIESRYEIKFLEIGGEKNHVHFLVQSVPTYSPTKIVTTIKSLTARKILEGNPEIKKVLWGGNFWTGGYYIGTVGEHGTERIITEYIKKHGGNVERYQKIYDEKQLDLFETM